jgi:hypothetical protein
MGIVGRVSGFLDNLVDPRIAVKVFVFFAECKALVCREKMLLAILEVLKCNFF